MAALTATPRVAGADDESSRPPTVAECVRTHTDGQVRRKEGAFLDARAELEVCAQSTCPRVIRNDCMKRLEALDAEVPSLVVVVRYADGRDAPGVEVTLDGAPLAGVERGRPVVVDPGTHALTATDAEGVSTSTEVVAVIGEQGRRVTLTLTPPEPEVTPEPEPVVAPPETSEGAGPWLIAGATLLGVGAVGFGVFAGLGLSGRSDLDALEDTCGANATPPNTCSDEELSAVEDKFLGADIALGVGAATAGVGLVMVVYALVSAGDGDDDEAEEVETAGWRFRPLASPHAFGGEVGLRF
ncbi:MAG: hypothetical protein AAF715_11525 [Myxococcota bacterium]